ncbi:MAG TPA: T9SS type A sorting domain-containing protein [Saprospiraceae bacterium]|nr:T9SS type A sorting domain-containing protein [Saprospiraceae bacterium]
MKMQTSSLLLGLLFMAQIIHAQFNVQIQVNQNVQCNGAADGALTAVVNPPGSTYSYLWSNGATSASLTGLPAGAYAVTVQNAAGGSAMATAILAEPEALHLTAITELPLLVNPTGSVEVETSGGTMPVEYQWVNQANIPFSNEEDLIDAPAGVYTQTATDANGCTFVLTPVTLTATSATREWDITQPLAVFPNPASEQIQLTLPESEPTLVQVFSATGQLCESVWLQGTNATVSLVMLPPGWYQVLAPSHNCTARLLIQR